MNMNRNQRPIEPQMEQCVSQVHEFVIKPAFRQTVTTTYCKNGIRSICLVNQRFQVTCRVNHVSQHQIPALAAVAPNYIPEVGVHRHPVQNYRVNHRVAYPYPKDFDVEQPRALKLLVQPWIPTSRGFSQRSREFLMKALPVKRLWRVNFIEDSDGERWKCGEEDVVETNRPSLEQNLPRPAYKRVLIEIECN